MAVGETTRHVAEIDLTPRIQRGGLTQVAVEFEAGGSTLVRAPLGDAKAAAREQTLPMSVSAKLKYAERQLANVPSTSDAEPLLAVRHYEIAEAVIKVGEGGKTPRLANDRRLIVVEAGTGRRVLYSPQGALRREQLDLVDTVGIRASSMNSCPRSRWRKVARGRRTPS
jgi:hypothetical protein